MHSYILKRLLLMIPTLIGILTITFIIGEFVPGGPADQVQAMLEGHGGGGSGGGEVSGAQGVGDKKQFNDPKLAMRLKRIFGFNNSRLERYLRTFVWYGRDSILSSREIDNDRIEPFYSNGRKCFLLRHDDKYYAYVKSWKISSPLVFQARPPTLNSRRDGTIFSFKNGSFYSSLQKQTIPSLPINVQKNGASITVTLQGGGEVIYQGAVFHDAAKGFTAKSGAGLLVAVGKTLVACPASIQVSSEISFDAQKQVLLSQLDGVTFAFKTGQSLSTEQAGQLEKLPLEIVSQKMKEQGKVIHYQDIYLAEPFSEAILNGDNWHGFFLLKFGNSITHNKPVYSLIYERLPISISLGVYSFLLQYIVCIILGIAKAVRNGQKFDIATSILIIFAYSIPGFVLAVLLIVYFGQGDNSIRVAAHSIVATLVFLNAWLAAYIFSFLRSEKAGSKHTLDLRAGLSYLLIAGLAAGVAYGIGAGVASLRFIFTSSLTTGGLCFLLPMFGLIALGYNISMHEGKRYRLPITTLLLYLLPSVIAAILLFIFLDPHGQDTVNGFVLMDGGLTSSTAKGYADWSVWRKILDYFHHIAVPVFCLSIGSFATLTMLTKNSILEQIHQLYAVAARARGLSESKVLYKHVFRNAMIPLVTGFPSGFMAMFFSGSLLIEKIFSLDGLGFLGYTAVMERDMPLILGNLFIFTIMGLLGTLLTDLCYVIVDPRISFEGSTG